MEKIDIVVSDNMTDAEVMKFIVKELGQKMLPKGGQKMIGSGYELQHMDTQINIKRIAVDAPVVTRECSVCSTTYEKSLAVSLWINYGGQPRRRHYCSEKCRAVVMEIAGGRCSVKRNDLQPIRSFR